ncbi:efflux RND transporter periplasmic adaptor subunit [Salinisphaera sp. P385]|uniref:Efflux RND transporter periplasmic adaptor subunit n=1 Tax=Spectribacter acetivorans TaxID=3075603 RepID=A0ABU3B5N4_9GAMM|nr:efflux RND transporter periplasmic adaptor subunit [Salinisphaera sp. P385]MDT0617493.1 efflux RND transporter periplasmic adaptor subunit [Salinisphaera sp. P385]
MMTPHSPLLRLLALLLVAIWLPPLQAAGGHDHGNGTAEQREVTGPHGGRLLEDGSFRLELAIVEDGVPPEFRAWATRDGQTVDPAAVDLEVRLERLGGRTDVIEFRPMDDFLRGRQTVVEPHSFDIVVRARYDGRDYRWRYASHEGRTRIPEQIADDGGLTIGTVGPATLRRTLSLTGRVRPDPDRVARVAARYPGAVERINAALYQEVEKGEALATVVARDSLQTTGLRAPFDGVVIERRAAVGQQSGDEPLFVIADLRQVWVELDAFSQDLAEIEVGQSVTVRDLEGAALASGEITHVAPTSGVRQNVHLRVPVDNPDGSLRPGRFVRGEVIVEQREVPRAVRRSALQRFRDFDVVYARFGETYEVRMLDLGARDDTWVEVLDGIETGTEYVTGNSFLIRADIEKSGASHDH